ncbi:hypothetical protein [Pantoea sp. Fr+CA_20]|uniref:hypothetical protein n=1 Tax=Pantoea sp. Fr+CA_20 TaxID=2929506 RepID=UPI0021190667|nr:hypothetical protein [Pantoea sp. Fr+CA_20]
MKEIPSRQMAVIGTNEKTGEEVYFKSAYYAPGFHRSGIKEAISGRAKSHRGYTWRYATKKEREYYSNH